MIVYENVAKFYVLFQQENHCKIRAFRRTILVWPSNAIGQLQTFLTPDSDSPITLTILHWNAMQEQAMNVI